MMPSTFSAGPLPRRCVLRGGLPLLLVLACAGCSTLGVGVDVGATAQQTQEFTHFRTEYNETNAAQLDEPLGPFQTMKGVQGGARINGAFGLFTAGLGMDVARASMGTAAPFVDGGQRSMKLTVSDVLVEVELGVGRSPRLIGGMHIRSNQLVASRTDANGVSTEGETGSCSPTRLREEQYCTLGTFDGYAYPFFAGVSWDVPLGRSLAPRLTLTKVLQAEGIEQSQLNGTVHHPDSDIRTNGENGAYRFSAFFPTRLGPSPEQRNVSGVLGGWRLALTLQFYRRLL